MLLDRAVDTVVIFEPPRAVESRLVRSELFTSRYERFANVPLGKQPTSYTLYRRR
jgi:hypothetical protein